MKNLISAGAMLGALALTTSASAEELRFDNLYVIGDSLSDGGTYSQGIVANGGGSLPNINYRFLTNAPDGSSRTYAEVLGQELGLDVQPNVINGVPAAGLPDNPVGGTNYAEGGSRVTNPAGIGFSVPGGVTTRPLSEQVDRLLADRPTLNSNDLVILWGGANDVFVQAGAVAGGAITPAQATANMIQAGTEMSALVDRVRAAGAETVIVVTIPDVGVTPGGVATGAAGAALQTALADTFNAQLRSSVGGKAVFVDSQKLLGAIQANPAHYGFTAPNAATVPACSGNSIGCIQGVNASADSEQRVFADGVHPTTSAHAMFGQAAFAGLQAGTQAGAIPVATMTALRQQSISIENRLNPTVLFYVDENGERKKRAVGQIDGYASIEGGSYSSEAQQVTPGLEGTTQVIKLGFDVPVTSNATLGFGISFDEGQVTFDGNRGGFDSKLVVGALFGQVALSPAFYLNAAVGGGRIDVTEITRSFTLGPARETYTAQTDGRYTFARIGGGALLPVSEQVLLNPFGQYTYEKVAIDGYTESNGAASLSYGDLEYQSDRLTLGLSAVISPTAAPDWVFNLRGSLEHDLNDDSLAVALGPDAATLGTVSAPRPDQTWGYFSATAARDLGNGALATFNASTSVGQDGATGYVASIAFKKTF